MSFQEESRNFKKQNLNFHQIYVVSHEFEFENDLKREFSDKIQHFNFLTIFGILCSLLTQCAENIKVEKN